MGIDIHMSIVRNGKESIPNIFDGRNSDWFRNLCGDGWDEEYDHLPSHYGIPDECPEKIKEDFDRPARDGYYGFYYIIVKDFKEWFEDYRPDLQAGWASTYDKWRIENKHYIPENGLPHYLDKEDNKDDMHFIEYANIYDCSRWLYQFLCDRNVPGDAYIVYYFDR